MKHLDLFSGIGGFALAASWVWGKDHEIVSFCEIEKYPQKILAKHWPGVPCHDDIKTLKGDRFGTIDLITGGFPCQPFSVAGKQGGSTDDRHLWPEMFRVIQEAKPTWIIGENVAGLINMVEFEQCFIDLESEGYETQAFIIPACGVDAKHRRNRVWIVGHSNISGTSEITRNFKKCAEFRKRNANQNTVPLYLAEQVIMWPTPAARDYRSPHGENSEAFLERMNHSRGVNLVEEMQRRNNGKPGDLNPTWVEWLMGYPAGWTDLKD